MVYTHAERNKRYRERHPERVVASLKRYRESHSEQLAVYHKSYNAEYGAANERRYRKNHLEECRERVRNTSHVRRSRLRNVFDEYVSMELIYTRDQGVCGVCHLHCPREERSIDHIIPISKGGRHNYSNVQTAHLLCNSRKGARLNDGLD